MNSAFIPIIVVMSVFFCAIPSALATLMVPLSIPELAAQSDLIVHGTVISINTRFDSDRKITTRVRLEIAETWKGRSANSRLEIVLAGGTLGAKQVIVDGQPNYSPGEEVVLFLKFNQRKEAVTVGLAQGKFVVWTNPHTDRKEAYNLFHGSPPHGTTTLHGPDSYPVAAERSLELAELKRIVVQNHH